MYPMLNIDSNDLEYAKKAYNNGDYLLSIAKSIDSSVKCEMPLIILTNDLSYLKEYAKNKINYAESYNIIPLSALSYYEYANNLNDTISKAMYYKYSSYYAQMDVDILKALNSSYIKYEPTYSIEKPIYIENTEEFNPYNTIIGLFVGIIIGFFGGYLFRRFT